MTWTGYIGLGTTDAAGNFTESTAAGYARHGFSFGSSISGKIQGYGNPITFTASSDVVMGNNAYSFYAGVSDVTPLFVYNLSQTFPYGINVNFVLNPYSILLNLVDGVNGDGMSLDINGASAVTGAAVMTDPTDDDRLTALEARVTALEAA